MKPIRLTLGILFVLIPGFLRAQVDVIFRTGHNYLVLTKANVEYVGRLLSQSDEEMMFDAIKTGLITLRKNEVKKALDVGPDGTKVKYGEPISGEISGGYGYKSAYARRNATLDCGNHVKFHRAVVAVSYSYWFKDIISFGVDVCEDHQWGSSTETNHGYCGYNVSNNENNITFAPRSIFNYTYKAKKGATSKVKLFGSCALGVRFKSVLNDTSTYGPRAPHRKAMDNSALLSYHISPIGIRMGGTLALYVELGYGYRGLINASLSYRPRPQISRLPTFRE